MKRLINSISSICISFTLVILGVAAMNLLSGYSADISGDLLALTIAAVTAVFAAVNLLELINIHNKILRRGIYIFTQYAVIMIILVLYLWVHKFPMTESIVKSTILFILIYFSTSLYYRKKSQIDAAQINRLLEKRSGSNSNL